ncbi:hypothetical protein [Halalkalibaculum sp. DA384]|uniref:hypothetical protein n=1 Tax=Halalkalibaculum sp. DA384 TaxID=3373606 RepID=UPI003754A9C3
MKNLKKPAELDSHKKWQEAQQKTKAIEQNIKDAKQKLKTAQKKLPKLEKQSNRLYQKDDINLDEMKRVDNQIEQCKKDIISCKEDWQDLEEELEAQRLKTAEAKQEFLEEASKQAEKIVDEFMPLLHKAKAYKDHIAMYSTYSGLSLNSIDNECMYYWTINDPEDFLSGFKQRAKALQNKNFKNRDLRELQPQQ